MAIASAFGQNAAHAFCQNGVRRTLTVVDADCAGA
jgi:hypothetical protein